MGVVYKATQIELKRTVALKMILTGGHASAQDLQRFQTEAEAVAHLQHPNIVQVHEIGRHQGFPYFSLEYCGDGTLKARLSDKPLKPQEAAGAIEILARAMDYAHRRGIVHRDLKPANILLQGTSYKITDFGLAKKLDAEDHQTHAGAVLGTPSYMAPEQARGEIEHVGPPADVYALGAILYEALTGKPPFKGPTTMDTLFLTVNQEPVSPRTLQPKVPRDLETICLKCLQKDPARRYATAGDLAEDLRRFLAGDAILARPAGPAERAWKWACRRPTLVALLGVLVLGTIGILALMAMHANELRDERDVAVKAQARASENLGKALQAVDAMLIEVADEQLIYEPRMEKNGAPFSPRPWRFTRIS
jgi:serine/threonine protein kinase